MIPKLLKKFLWVLLFYSIFFISYRVSQVDGIPQGTLFGFNFLENFNFKNNTDNINGFIVLSSTKFISLLLPIFLISSIEIFKSKTLFSGLKNTSISKITQSKGYKYADVWYFFLELLRGQFAFITILLTIGISNISNTLEKYFDQIFNTLSIPSNQLSLTILFIFSILLKDVLWYLNHFLQHKYPILWDSHEFHHSPTEMTILSKDRGSPFQFAFFNIPAAPLTILIGLIITKSIKMGFLLPCYIFFFDEVIYLLSLYLGHSQLKIIFPKPLSYIYMSPSLHWLHHSSNPKHFNKNFGQRYPFWDMLFGTYLDETHLRDIKSYGLPHSQYNKHHPLYAYSLVPLIKLFKRTKFLLKKNKVYSN